jgi:phage shock protein A
MSPFKREEHHHLVDRELLYMILENQFLIFQKLNSMSGELKNLQDAAAKTLTVEEAVLAVLNSQKSTIDDLKKQLADAIANGNDPTAIQAVADQLNQESDKVNNAIAALQAPAQGSGDTTPAPDQSGETQA